MKDSKKELKAKFQGYVQGVGFRAHVQREARSLGLVGAVWNENDGSVGLVAQGEEDSLREFIDRILNGVGRVDKVETEWKEPEGGFFSFDIRFR